MFRLRICSCLIYSPSNYQTIKVIQKTFLRSGLQADSNNTEKSIHSLIFGVIAPKTHEII
jgi:hypothetical protein